jgi:hypothetical protein
LALARAPIFNLQCKLLKNSTPVTFEWNGRIGPFFRAELTRVGLSNPNATKATIQNVLEEN